MHARFQLHRRIRSDGSQSLSSAHGLMGLRGIGTGPPRPAASGPVAQRKQAPWGCANGLSQAFSIGFFPFSKCQNRFFCVESASNMVQNGTTPIFTQIKSYFMDN